MYSTHGFITPADMQEYREDYDLDVWQDDILTDADGDSDHHETCEGHETIVGDRVVAVVFCKAGHMCVNDL